MGKYGYYEIKHTLGLLKHPTNGIIFTLVVDDFGVKFEEDKNLQHLIDTLQTYYEIEINKDEKCYCIITLD